MAEHTKRHLEGMTCEIDGHMFGGALECARCGVANIGEINALKDRVRLLEEAVRELLIYVSPTPKRATAALCKGGYTSELVPRFTQIGTVKVADRIEVIRSLVIDPDKKEDDDALR